MNNNVSKPIPEPIDSPAAIRQRHAPQR